MTDIPVDKFDKTTDNLLENEYPINSQQKIQQEVEIEEVFTLSQLVNNKKPTPSKAQKFTNNTNTNNQRSNTSNQDFQHQIDNILNQQNEENNEQNLRSNQNVELTQGKAYLICPKCRKGSNSIYEHKRLSKYAFYWCLAASITGFFVYLYCKGCKKNHQHVHKCQHCNFEIAVQEPQCGSFEDMIQ